MMSLQNLKDVLADLIPKEQSRIKNFKQQYGKNNIGQITVDMVSRCWGAGGGGSVCNGLRPKCVATDFFSRFSLITKKSLQGLVQVEKVILGHQPN